MSGKGRLTDPASIRPQLTGLPITGPLVEGQRYGSFVYEKLVFSNANTDTSFTTRLGRTPSVYLDAGQKQAGSVYDGSNNRADWTLDTIVLRASAIGTYWRLIA